MVVEIRLPGGQIGFLDDEDKDLLSKNIYLFQRGYFAFWDGQKKVGLHRVVLGRMLGKELASDEFCDHVNNNRLDNRRCNLRICTKQQNSVNRKKKSNTTSKYIGVCWHYKQKKWIANFTYQYKKTYVGYFNDEIEAAKARDEAVKKLHGQYAKLNFEQVGE